ncbi:MAG: efflux RND transporter periplasmic adaptor subunit [Acidobacteriota bacterium]
MTRIQTVKPERQDLNRTFQTPGSIRAYEEATLYSRVTGYLEWIGVDIGDAVKKGQVIARISVPEMEDEYQQAQAKMRVLDADLENARAEVERAKAEHRLKQITYQRLRQVREEEPEVASQQSVDEAEAEFQVAAAGLGLSTSRVHQVSAKMEAAEAALSRLRTLMAYAEIEAPFAGIVTERMVDRGTLIESGASGRSSSNLVKVARIDKVRVIVDVPESEVPFVSRGDPAVIRVDSLKGTEFAGEVTRFASALDPETRTMKTEIDILNRKRRLFPGMYGSVSLTLERHAGAITVPVTALRSELDAKFVFIAKGGLAKKIEVETGLDNGITVEITRGLRGDEEVVTQSNHPLKDGTRVSSRLAPEGTREDRS